MDNESQQVPPIPNKPEIKTAKNLSFAKTLSYGFVIVSVGVSIAIGGYLLGVSKTKPQPAIQTSATPVVSPTPDPTANWQTYVNADFDIEFKHPLGWNVAQTFDVRTPTLVVGLQEKIDYLKKVNFQVGGGVAPIGILKDNSINIPSSDSSKTVTSRAITIGEVNAIEYTTTWKVDLPGVGAGDVTISTHIKNASTTYVVNLNNISYREIYNQILSTFKFINSGAQNGNFIISISFRNRDEKKYIEIKNIPLPIDSETEACDLLSQVNSAVYKGNKFGCSASDKGSYWEFNNKIICEPSFPFPCRGGLSGKLNKSNGNIDGFEAVIVS